MIDPHIISKTYNERFSWNPNQMNPGVSGYDSGIITYDALVDCKNNWETLVVYSILNVGDGDPTGTITGRWYKVLYGYNIIPKSSYKYL
jgi:hypothetical protein